MTCAPESIAISPIKGPISATLAPPGSKSLTNRALICAALANGASTLRGALLSEDTQVMIESLNQLGISARIAEDETTIAVSGCGGMIPAPQGDLFIANSGTSVRFLTAMVATGRGTYRLHGTKRMHERPIQDLIDALGQLGVAVVSEAGTGCPPVVVQANGLPGGLAQVRGDVSSQFLSGLLMAAPYAESPLTLEVVGPLVSIPYLRMTLAVMADFGVRFDVPDIRRIAVPRQHYQGTIYAVEPDASAASYLWAAAAITGGTVTVPGLSRNSLQGDVRFCEVLEQMGCRVEWNADSIRVTGGTLRGVDVDMNEISDTVQTLTAVALSAEAPTRVRGVAHNRHKETDRIGNLAIELRKFGVQVDEHEDGLTVHPRPVKELHGATIDTYQDHRMAMSLALVGLRVPGIVINDPGCTVKTYPQFFDDLAKLCATAGR